ncbi:MAG: DUF362 domain-containing protein [Candidatus Altiarchaeota archaeon]
MSPIVGIVQDEEMSYDIHPPFKPPKIYPEFPLEDGEVDEKNSVYAGVRNLFVLLDLDKENHATPQWNPLGKIIKPGDSVVLKPNFVICENELNPEVGTDCLLTHASVLRPIIDYCLIALAGKGKITIADAPYRCTDFEKVLEKTRTAELVSYYKEEQNIDIEVINIMPEQRIEKDGKIVFQKMLPGDPRGSVVVKLGAESMLEPITTKESKFYYRDESEPGNHHRKGFHEYSISKTVLEADALISVPKLKTHGKTGVTLALKNMVGIVAEKAWLPHYRLGPPPEGDEMPSEMYCDVQKRRGIASKIKKVPILGHILRAYFSIRNQLRKKGVAKEDCSVRNGEWPGNDTVWRTIYDLNRIVSFADKKGKIKNSKQRNLMVIVDGVVGGEGYGPLSNTPVSSKVIFGGFDPIAIEYTGADLMGIDPQRITTLKNLTQHRKPFFGEKNPEKIEKKTNCEIKTINFKLSPAWIE